MSKTVKRYLLRYWKMWLLGFLIVMAAGSMVFFTTHSRFWTTLTAIVADTVRFLVGETDVSC